MSDNPRCPRCMHRLSRCICKSIQEKIDDKTERLRAEIKELRSLDAHADKTIERLRSQLAEKDKRIEELDGNWILSHERIEELENSRFELLDHISALSGEEDFHVITHDQIDKAWERLSVHGAESWSDYTMAVFDTLDDIGIVSCPKCGGSAIRRGYSARGTCPDCKGHGWVKSSELVDKHGQFGITLED